MYFIFQVRRKQTPHAGWETKKVEPDDPMMTPRRHVTHSTISGSRVCTPFNVLHQYPYVCTHVFMSVVFCTVPKAISFTAISVAHCNKFRYNSGPENETYRYRPELASELDFFGIPTPIPKSPGFLESGLSVSEFNLFGVK